MPAVIVCYLGEGMAPEVVAERTSMPLEIVKQIAGNQGSSQPRNNQYEEETASMTTLLEPEVIEHEPFLIIGAYATYEGEDEGPGWSVAAEAFHARRDEITDQKDDLMVGFLYRPHRDDPTIPESVHACFVGVEVIDIDHVPEGLSATRFPGGRYVIVACQGETENDAAMAVGEGVQRCEAWIAENAYQEGEACFACSHENAPRPPYIEYVYTHFV
jgi:predicted transcriptional regulator YdeE